MHFAPCSIGGRHTRAPSARPQRPTRHNTEPCETQLAIQTPGGIIRIWITYDGEHNEVLALSAPKVEGVHQYTFSDTAEAWVASDQHFLKEILARELVYWCKGYPDF